MEMNEMELLKRQLVQERVQHGLTKAIWALGNQKALKTMSSMVAIHGEIAAAGAAYQSLAQAVDEGRAIIMLDTVVLPGPRGQHLDDAVSMLTKTHH